MRLTRTLAAGSLCALAAAALTAFAPTSAPAATYSAQAVFNVPGENAERDYAIETAMVGLIDGVPAGGEIRMAAFSWSDPTVADALGRAKQRGAKVYVVLDETGGGVNTGADNAAMASLRAGGLDLLKFCGKTSSSTAGSTACVGNHAGSINHNKLALFSASGSDTNIAVVSSFNYTFTQNNLWNNSVIVRNEPQIYGALKAYFGDLQAERKNNNYFNAANGYFKSTLSNFTLYMSPRATSGGGSGEETSTDTVRNTLTYVTYESGCTVEAAQAMFTDARSAVAAELLRIARAGCKVRLIYGTMGKAFYDTVHQSANVTTKRYTDRETTNVDGREVSVHSKYFIVKGKYNGVAGRTIVFTGSHNITSPALRQNDEIYAKFEDAGVAAAFRSNFASMWSRAKCVNPENGRCTWS